MSNSCRMPLKAYLQCIRKTECFKQDPADDRMELCSRDKHVQEECSTFETNYKQCKRHLIDGSSRIRGNKALRQGNTSAED